MNPFHSRQAKVYVKAPEVKGLADAATCLLEKRDEKGYRDALKQNESWMKKNDLIAPFWTQLLAVQAPKMDLTDDMPIYFKQWITKSLVTRRARFVWMSLKTRKRVRWYDCRDVAVIGSTRTA